MSSWSNIKPVIIGGLGMAVAVGSIITTLNHQPTVEPNVEPQSPVLAKGDCKPAVIRIGMSRAELIAACGLPPTINASVVDGGKLDEQWVYGGITHTSNVYLTGLRVRSWQYEVHPER